MSRRLVIAAILISVAAAAQQSAPPTPTSADPQPPNSTKEPAQVLLKVDRFTIYVRGDSYVFKGDPNYPEGRSVDDSSMVTLRSTVSIGQDPSVRWETLQSDDNHVGDSKKAYRCSTVRSYNGVLSVDQMQQLQSIIGKDTFTRLDNAYLKTDGLSVGSSVLGTLSIWRGDHLQVLAFTVGRRPKAAKGSADTKEQEKADKDVQNVMHWIEEQVQKPHKSELRKDTDKCTPSS